MTTTNEKNERDLMLDVRDLTIHYETDSGVVHAVEGLNLQLGRGESLGFVGETDANKTTTALGIMHLTCTPRRIRTDLTEELLSPACYWCRQPSIR